MVHARCGGLDVHERSVVACLRVQEGRLPTKQVASFGTTTAELEWLRAWLLARGCTHAAMESMGVYWKSVYAVLEGAVQLLLVNA